mgnify:CR=1 FL=1
MKLFVTFVILMVLMVFFLACIIFLFDLMGLLFDLRLMFVQWISEKINGTDDDI